MHRLITSETERAWWREYTWRKQADFFYGVEKMNTKTAADLCSKYLEPSATDIADAGMYMWSSWAAGDCFTLPPETNELDPVLVEIDAIEAKYVNEDTDPEIEELYWSKMLFALRRIDAEIQEELTKRAHTQLCIDEINRCNEVLESMRSQQHCTCDIKVLMDHGCQCGSTGRSADECGGNK